MRVLLVGANGFIGSNLAKRLLNNDCRILALVPENEICNRLDPVIHEIEIIRGDLNLSAANKKSIAGWNPDICINLAWFTGKDYLSSEINSDLQRASFTFFKDLVDIGMKKFIFSGTCAEYAENDKALDENSPVGPTTPYAAAKLGLLEDIQGSNEYSKVDFVWARLFFPYGPGEAVNRITPSVILSLLGNREFATTPGEQARDYLYVDDIADAIIALMYSGSKGVFNISSAIPVLLKQYLTIIAEKLGKRELLKIGGIPVSKLGPSLYCRK